MNTDKPKATCSNPCCRYVIDLTDYRVRIANTPHGGIVKCPHCSGTAYLSPQMTAQVQADWKARG